MMKRSLTFVSTGVLAVVLSACGVGSMDAEKAEIAKDIADCKANDGYACYMMGLTLDTGTPEERTIAASYYQQAAGLLESACAEEAQACLLLGDMHHWAQGMAVNEDLALGYYQKGIDLLDQDCTDQIADACMDLQSRYETGEGVDADPVKASIYLRKAKQSQ